MSRQHEIKTISPIFPQGRSRFKPYQRTLAPATAQNALKVRVKKTGSRRFWTYVAAAFGETSMRGFQGHEERLCSSNGVRGSSALSARLSLRLHRAWE